MIHDKGKLFPIVDSMARHYESKILTLQSLYSPKECTTDAVLQKYGDTLARCTSFGPYFNNGNQNLPRLKITTANACATRPPKTVGIYGGGGRRTPPAHFPLFGICMLCNGKQHCRVYITYVIIRNVFKTIYDVYIYIYHISNYPFI
jgi:hypothetical protein